MGQATSAAKEPDAVPINLPVAVEGDPQNSDIARMRAWVVPSKGHEPIATSIAVPKPSTDFVLVRVAAAGLNLIDVHRGDIPTHILPGVLGIDGAGVVEAVDSAAPEDLSELVGQRVMFRVDNRGGLGALSEFTLVHRAMLVPLPPAITFADAATLPTSAVAAYMALFSKLRVEAGKSILVTAAAGAVGGYAVQLAKLANLTVIATCSAYNVEHVKARGANYVIDYTSMDMALHVRHHTQNVGVDYVLDLVESSNSENMIPHIKAGGHYCTLCGAASPAAQILAARRGISVHYVNIDASHESSSMRADLVSSAKAVVQLLSSGQLKSNLGELCPFDSVGQALKSIAKRHTRGKLVVTVMRRKDATKKSTDDVEVPAKSPETTAATPDDPPQKHVVSTSPAVKPAPQPTAPVSMNLQSVQPKKDANVESQMQQRPSPPAGVSQHPQPRSSQPHHHSMAPAEPQVVNYFPHPSLTK